MRRFVSTLCGCVLALALTTSAVAQEPSSPTTEPAPTTTQPLLQIPGLTPTTAGPPTSGPPTTSTTVPDESDPVGHVDAPSEDVPVTDETVPLGPGAVVDGAAASEVIRREITVARAEALQSAQAVAAAAADVDALEARLAALQTELATLDVAQELAVRQLSAAETSFHQRIADAVIRGNSAMVDSLLVASDSGEASTRNVLLRSVAEADRAALDEYQAAKRVVDAGVLAALDDVAVTRRALRDARHLLEQELSLNAERRFELAVFAAGSEIVIRGFVFPVGQPYDFIDSWGFPRMVGTEYSHGHQGVDIMAPFGTPLYATERGVITRTGSDVLGGTKLWLKGESGTYYYYAHLQSYADGVAPGMVVEAGDVVGFVGDTGNAKGGAPHLHFEIHPGGGPAVNPYGLLKVVSDLMLAA